jgi:hypothetical protein
MEATPYSIIPCTTIQARQACLEHSNFFKANPTAPERTPGEEHPPASAEAPREGRGNGPARSASLPPRGGGRERRRGGERRFRIRPRRPRPAEIQLRAF